MPWQTVQQDGGEWLRKWHQTRLENLLRLSGKPPESLCIDELNLTVCCRYAETLLKNAHIKRYLMKYHRRELLQLEAILADFYRQSGLTT
jgi:hypothetical protein